MRCWHSIAIDPETEYMHVLAYVTSLSYDALEYDSIGLLCYCEVLTRSTSLLYIQSLYPCGTVLSSPSSTTCTSRAPSLMNMNKTTGGNVVC
jgi:hypothetical protein